MLCLVIAPYEEHQPYNLYISLYLMDQLIYTSPRSKKLQSTQNLTYHIPKILWIEGTLAPVPHLIQSLLSR